MQKSLLILFSSLMAANFVAADVITFPEGSTVVDLPYEKGIPTFFLMTAVTVNFRSVRPKDKRFVLTTRYQ